MDCPPIEVRTIVFPARMSEANWMTSANLTSVFVLIFLIRFLFFRPQRSALERVQYALYAYLAQQQNAQKVHIFSGVKF